MLSPLVRVINSWVHEVAPYGCERQLPDQLYPDELNEDLIEGKKILENITGAEVIG